MYPDNELTDDDQSLDDEELQRLLNMGFSDTVHEESHEWQQKQKGIERKTDFDCGGVNKIEEREDVEFQKKIEIQEKQIETEEICPLSGLKIKGKEVTPKDGTSSDKDIVNDISESFINETEVHLSCSLEEENETKEDPRYESKDNVEKEKPAFESIIENSEWAIINSDVSKLSENIIEENLEDVSLVKREEECTEEIASMFDAFCNIEKDQIIKTEDSSTLETFDVIEEEKSCTSKSTICSPSSIPTLSQVEEIFLRQKKQHLDIQEDIFMEETTDGRKKEQITKKENDGADTEILIQEMKSMTIATINNLEIPGSKLSQNGKEREETNSTKDEEIINETLKKVDGLTWKDLLYENLDLFLKPYGRCHHQIEMQLESLRELDYVISHLLFPIKRNEAWSTLSGLKGYIYDNEFEKSNEITRIEEVNTSCCLDRDFRKTNILYQLFNKLLPSILEIPDQFTLNAWLLQFVPCSLYSSLYTIMGYHLETNNERGEAELIVLEVLKIFSHLASLHSYFLKSVVQVDYNSIYTPPTESNLNSFNINKLSYYQKWQNNQNTFSRLLVGVENIDTLLAESMKPLNIIDTIGRDFIENCMPSMVIRWMTHFPENKKVRLALLRCLRSCMYVSLFEETHGENIISEDIKVEQNRFNATLWKIELHQVLEFTENESLHSELSISTLSELLCNARYPMTQEIVNADGCMILVEILKDRLCGEEVAVSCLECITSMIHTYPEAATILGYDCCDTVCVTIYRYASSRQLLNSASSTIEALCLYGNTRNRDYLIQTCGLIPLLMDKCMAYPQTLITILSCSNYYKYTCYFGSTLRFDLIHSHRYKSFSSQNNKKDLFAFDEGNYFSSYVQNELEKYGVNRIIVNALKLSQANLTSWNNGASEVSTLKSGEESPLKKNNDNLFSSSSNLVTMIGSSDGILRTSRLSAVKAEGLYRLEENVSKTEENFEAKSNISSNKSIVNTLVTEKVKESEIYSNAETKTNPSSSIVRILLEVRLELKTVLEGLVLGYLVCYANHTVKGSLIYREVPSYVVATIRKYVRVPCIRSYACSFLHEMDRGMHPLKYGSSQTSNSSRDQEESFIEEELVSSPPQNIVSKSNTTTDDVNKILKVLDKKAYQEIKNLLKAMSIFEQDANVLNYGMDSLLYLIPPMIKFTEGCNKKDPDGKERRRVSVLNRLLYQRLNYTNADEDDCHETRAHNLYNIYLSDKVRSEFGLPLLKTNRNQRTDIKKISTFFGSDSPSLSIASNACPDLLFSHVTNLIHRSILQFPHDNGIVISGLLILYCLEIYFQENPPERNNKQRPIERRIILKDFLLYMFQHVDNDLHSIPWQNHLLWMLLSCEEIIPRCLSLLCLRQEEEEEKDYQESIRVKKKKKSSLSKENSGDEKNVTVHRQRVYEDLAQEFLLLMRLKEVGSCLSLVDQVGSGGGWNERTTKRVKTPEIDDESTMTYSYLPMVNLIAISIPETSSNSKRPQIDKSHPPHIHDNTNRKKLNELALLLIVFDLMHLLLDSLEESIRSPFHVSQISSAAKQIQLPILFQFQCKIANALFKCYQLTLIAMINQDLRQPQSTSSSSNGNESKKSCLCISVTIIENIMINALSRLFGVDPFESLSGQGQDQQEECNTSDAHIINVVKGWDDYLEDNVALFESYKMDSSNNSYDVLFQRIRQNLMRTYSARVDLRKRVKVPIDDREKEKEGKGIGVVNENFEKGVILEEAHAILDYSKKKLNQGEGERMDMEEANGDCLCAPGKEKKNNSNDRITIVTTATAIATAKTTTTTTITTKDNNNENEKKSRRRAKKRYRKNKGKGKSISPTSCSEGSIGEADSTISPAKVI